MRQVNAALRIAWLEINPTSSSTRVRDRASQELQWEVWIKIGEVVWDQTEGIERVGVLPGPHMRIWG